MAIIRTPSVSIESTAKILSENAGKIVDYFQDYINHGGNFQKVFSGQGRTFRNLTYPNVTSSTPTKETTVPVDKLESGIFKNPAIQKAFSSAYNNWKIDGTENGFTTLENEFLNRFFVPIEKTKEWQTFWDENTKGMEEKEKNKLRYQIAGALVLKLLWSIPEIDKGDPKSDIFTKIMMNGFATIQLAKNRAEGIKEVHQTAFGDKLNSIIFKDFANPVDFKANQLANDFIKNVILGKLKAEENLKAIVIRIRSTPYFQAMGEHGESWLNQRLQDLNTEIDKGITNTSKGPLGLKETDKIALKTLVTKLLDPQSKENKKIKEQVQKELEKKAKEAKKLEEQEKKKQDKLAKKAKKESKEAPAPKTSKLLTRKDTERTLKRLGSAIGLSEQRGSESSAPMRKHAELRLSTKMSAPTYFSKPDAPQNAAQRRSAQVNPVMTNPPDQTTPPPQRQQSNPTLFGSKSNTNQDEKPNEGKQEERDERKEREEQKKSSL